mmetsp:Transcript_45418/g.89311  ORF Transcript_45418/g.89311 Transcript_45418/m.89311 type:complete len:94 (+) Transcript_45418:195-476(+)
MDLLGVSYASGWTNVHRICGQLIPCTVFIVWFCFDPQLRRFWRNVVRTRVLGKDPLKDRGNDKGFVRSTNSTVVKRSVISVSSNVKRPAPISL